MSARALNRIRSQVVRCRRCPRLTGYREALRARYPGYWCRPVPSFGDPAAWLVIVGLAPGLHGANRSGRPFFMDASGEWLYGELARRRLWDGERLHGTCILNAVKCVPPQNRPSTAEQDECLGWLEQELAALAGARVVLSLGAIAHRAVLRAWRLAPQRRFAFRHEAVYPIGNRAWLLSSYHPSRQNTNTGKLSRAMWQRVFARTRELRAMRLPG